MSTTSEPELLPLPHKHAHALANLSDRSPSPTHVPARGGRYMESDDAHPCIALDDNTRVIDCKNNIQWLLQRRSSHQWRSVSYCRSRDALIREARKHVEHGCEVLRSLPEYHA